MKFEKLKKGENPENDKLNKESLIFAMAISISALIIVLVLGLMEKISLYEALIIIVMVIPLVFFSAWVTQRAVTRMLAPEGTNHIVRMVLLALAGGICLIIVFAISRINMRQEIRFLAECILIGVSIFTIYSALIMLVGLVADPVICFFKYKKWRRK